MSNEIKNIPEWAKDVVWYQIFPERFYNGDKSNDPKLQDINEGNIKGWKIADWTSDWYALAEWEKNNFKNVFQSVFSRRYGGDIQGIINKLDYLQELGITAIYLNPVFRSPSLHKYDGSSFHHIDENFGPDPEGDRKLLAEAGETDDPSTWIWTSADRHFLQLVQEAHKRNLKIIIDGVFNHSGRQFFAFRDILKNKQKSKYKDWYEITKWAQKSADGFEYKGWFGHKSLPEFKEDENGLNEGYKQYIFNITKRWMKPHGDINNGIDGWRLDVAFCLPHGFWKEWRSCVKSINPSAYITAEVVEIAPEYLQGDEFDAMMNYPFAYTAAEYFIDKKKKISASEFDNRLADLRKAYPEEINYVMQNLMSSHDTARLASIIVNPDLNYRDFGGFFNRSRVGANPDYRLDRGDNNNLATHKLLVIFQMTYIGAPMIYYGDEVRMTGANDPDCRKPMLWEEFSYDDETVHPVAVRRRLPEKNKVNKELLEHYKKLIKIRHCYPALRRGSFKSAYINNKQDVYGFVREYKNEFVLVIMNNSSKHQKVKLDLSGYNISSLIDVLNENKRYPVVDNSLKLSVKARWAVILIFH